MADDTVYRKTESGAAEVRERKLRLTPRVRTISDISATFGTGPESRFSVAGWCCP